MDKNILTLKEIENLKNVTVSQLGQQLQSDILDMGIIDENMSVYEYLKHYIRVDDVGADTDIVDALNEAGNISKWKI